MWVRYETKNPGNTYALRATLKRYHVHFVIDGNCATIVREPSGGTSGQSRRGRGYGAKVMEVEQPPEFPAPCGQAAISERQAGHHSRHCKQCQGLKEAERAAMAARAAPAPVEKEKKEEADMPKPVSNGYAGVKNAEAREQLGSREPVVTRPSAEQQVVDDLLLAGSNGREKAVQGHEYTSAGVPKATGGYRDGNGQSVTPRSNGNGVEHRVSDIATKLDAIETQAMEIAEAAGELRRSLDGMVEMEQRMAELQDDMKKAREALSARFGSK